MHKIAFYPVGNGDTSQIILSNNRRILFDFRELQDQAGYSVGNRLREELKECNRDSFDVVAFTHGDKDHIAGCMDFFELDHAQKYQGSSRIKIKELWVPAAILVEQLTNLQQSSDLSILRQEARYRLRKGEGIRVFSKPDLLKDWFEKEGLSFAERKHLITDAGQIVPGFNISNDGVEFFCHSPFVEHTADGDIERNDSSLVFQVRFMVRDTLTNYLAVGDSKAEVLEQIVQVINYHKNQGRLDWDLFNIPHHCSAYALSNKKGERQTEPLEGVKELLMHGQEGAYIISSSFPVKSDFDAHEQSLPPHIQAKKCYEHYLRQVKGRDFIVTMEYPNERDPQPIEFEITEFGCSLKDVRRRSPISIITSSPAPRAG